MQIDKIKMQPGPKIEQHNTKAMLYKNYRRTVKVKTNWLYYSPKRRSNKIWVLQTKFEFVKKNEFNIPTR